jgi:hypothetical protein
MEGRRMNLPRKQRQIFQYYAGQHPRIKYLLINLSIPSIFNQAVSTMLSTSQ